MYRMPESSCFFACLKSCLSAWAVWYDFFVNSCIGGTLSLRDVGPEEQTLNPKPLIDELASLSQALSSKT